VARTPDSAFTLRTYATREMAPPTPWTARGRRVISDAGEHEPMLEGSRRETDYATMATRICQLGVDNLPMRHGAVSSEGGDLMELTQQPAAGRAEEHLPPEGWPTFIRTKVFYGREDDHWYAIDADFDIASMGATADEALASLQRMVSSYLTSYVHEGQDFATTKRPIPFKQRLKLRTQVLLGKPLRVLRRGQDTAQEGDFLFPSMIQGR
jgi:hypothetical protein